MLSTAQTSVGVSTISDHESDHRTVPIRVTIRRLQLCGFSPIEAANLTARLVGLPATRSGWNPRQVEHLVFLRTIVASGRLST